MTICLIWSVHVLALCLWFVIFAWSRLQLKSSARPPRLRSSKVAYASSAMLIFLFLRCAFLWTVSVMRIRRYLQRDGERAAQRGWLSQGALATSSACGFACCPWTLIRHVFLLCFSRQNGCLMTRKCHHDNMEEQQMAVNSDCCSLAQISTWAQRTRCRMCVIMAGVRSAKISSPPVDVVLPTWCKNTVLQRKII